MNQNILDKPYYVAVWLRVMRNRAVTHLRDAVFQALADPTRRAVLDMLREGSRSAGEIARVFPVSRPATSKQLRRLRQAELVREHRRGRHRLYAINPAPLKEVDRWLMQYRVFWKGKLAGLKAFVKSELKVQPKKR
jgi:DNA-binding transcriptional ArsR family regulator